MNSTLTSNPTRSVKAPASTGKLGSIGHMRIISAHKYVSTWGRSLTPEERDVRRVAYALKTAKPDACDTAARDLAPLVDAAEHPETRIVLMPVPASDGSTQANRSLANAIAAEIHRRYPTRRVQIKNTVARRHAVESSCVRRKRGLPGLRADEHAIIRTAGPLTATGTAYYFVDNVATVGATLAACRAALGFGDGLVWADQGRVAR